jgi:hypothetical protein
MLSYPRNPQEPSRSCTIVDRLRHANSPQALMVPSIADLRKNLVLSMEYDDVRQ